MTTKLGLIIGAAFVLLATCMVVFAEPNTLPNCLKLDIAAAYLPVVLALRIFLQVNFVKLRP